MCYVVKTRKIKNFTLRNHAKNRKITPVFVINLINMDIENKLFVGASYEIEDYF